MTSCERVVPLKSDICFSGTENSGMLVWTLLPQCVSVSPVPSGISWRCTKMELTYIYFKSFSKFTYFNCVTFVFNCCFVRFIFIQRLYLSYISSVQISRLQTFFSLMPHTNDRKVSALRTKVSAVEKSAKIVIVGKKTWLINSVDIMIYALKKNTQSLFAHKRSK